MTDSEEVSSVSDVGENETTESEEIEQNTEESNWVGDEGTAEDHMTEPTTETSEWEDDMRTAESEVTEPTSEEITESEEIKPLSTETEEEGESIMAEGELKNTSEVGDMEDTGISELGPGEGLEEGKDFKPDSSEGGVESEENTKEGEEFESGTVERLPTIQELVEEIITRGTKDYGEYQLGEEDEPRTPERLPTIQELLDEIITRGTKDYGEYQLGEEDEPRPPERLPTIQELLEEIITRGTKDYGKSQLGEEDEPRPPERLPTVQELLEEILKRGIGETTKSESRIAGRRPTIQELLEEIIRRGTGEQVERDEDELREDEFKLSFVYLMTFTDRFRDGTRELIVRGNDLYLRKGHNSSDDDEEEDEKKQTEEQQEFELSCGFLMALTEKLQGDRRELIIRGNDIFLHKRRRLRDVDMRIVCEFLHENPHVVSVDLAYNEITDKGIGIIADFLSTHDSVRRLNVMGNNIGPEGIKKLADLGEKFPLESLRVNGNKIGVEGGKSLAAILDYNVRLRQLDMGQTDQTLSSLVYITTALYANTTLQILDLSRPLGLFMHALDSAHWAETLGLALQFNKTLQELHLQKSDLIDHDIELMLIGMKYNNNLLLLDLGCNRLGNHSMEILGSYLKQRPALIALILDHNHIGDLGARCLSFTMPFSKIQLLDLSHNKVTDVGLGEILMTVKKTVRLRAFYIWGNPITPKSCPMLGRLIRGGVLQKDWVDFEIYTVDGVDYLAYQNVDRSRHIYYCVGDFAFPQPRPLPKPRSAMPPTAMLLPRIPFSAKYIPFSPTHPRLKGGPPYLRRHPEENPTQVRASTMTSALTSMSRRSVGRFGSTTETSYTERDISIQTDPE